MKMYFDPGQKFSLVYPAHWFARGTHDSINENDLLIFSFSDSKRTFYKSLTNASQILGSITISR